jgi:hypothetical protein
MRDIERGDSPSAGIPDEQRIERLRRTIASFDRWGGFLKAIYLLASFTFVATLVFAMILMNGMRLNFGNMANGMGGGFVVGLLLGSMLGLFAVNVGHGLIMAFSGLRNERLLIHYHDAYRELHEGDGEDLGNAGFAHSGDDR